MECDVAVLGGGPGGYTAAIRAAQLGARRSASRRSRSSAEPACASAASRPRPGSRRPSRSRRPRRRSRSWASKSARSDPRLRHREPVEGRRRQADDERRRVALQGERRRVGQGHRPLQGREHDRGRRRRGRHLQAGDHRHRLGSAPPADRRARLAALRRLDRPPRPDRAAAPPGRPRRRDHRLRIRVDLQPFRLRGDDHRDAPEADPEEDDDASAELAKQFKARHRAPPREAVQAGRGPRAPPSPSTSATARRSRPT